MNKKTGIVALLIWITLYYLGANNYCGQVSSLICLLLIIYMSIRALWFKRYDICFVFVFMFNYALVPVKYYFFEDVNLGNREEALSSSTIYNVSLSLFLFVAVLVYNIQINHTHKFQILKIKNEIVYYIFVIMGFVGTLSSMPDNNILAGDMYSASNFKSSLYEYTLIPIILSFIYATTIVKKIISNTLVFLFCGITLLAGGRIGVVMLLVAVFLINYQAYISRKQLIVIFLFGIIGMTLIEQIRLGGTVSIIGNTGSAIQYVDVFYASARIFYFIEIDFLDIADRIKSFIFFLASVFVPYSQLPAIANLSSYAQGIYSSGGGGLAPVFFYAWGGYFGVVAFGLFVSHILNILTRKTSDYLYIYGILLVAFTPRWFAYYPITAIKLCVYGMVIYYIINKLCNRHYGASLSTDL